MRLVVEWRRSARLFWYRTDREAWIFGFAVVLILALFGSGFVAVFDYRDQSRSRVLDFHRQSVECLARNIYYEARGEPLAGQYAVAEVTMNRKASRRFPETVCEVVQQKSWDPIRRRYVGAFSWTEFAKVPEPTGEEWRRARAVAEAVYYGKNTPQVQGALFYHADYIKPDWAKQKKPVARIGRHIFYR